ncbi:hypothetical protein T03_2097, partial [Trichinella britovi]
MDYVNMREFPSSRSRCHSQIAFPTGSVFPCQTIIFIFTKQHHLLPSWAHFALLTCSTAITICIPDS